MGATCKQTTKLQRTVTACTLIILDAVTGNKMACIEKVDERSYICVKLYAQLLFYAIKEYRNPLKREQL